VPPAGSVALTVAVTAPTNSGATVLEHQLVEETVAWFPQVQDVNVTVS
jgi:hypothetical protein